VETTPWTLTSNVAAAVGPDLTYARVRQGEESTTYRKGTLHMLRGPYEVLSEMKGTDLVDGPTMARSTSWRRSDSRVVTPCW